jgi:starch phosphorylase
VYAAPRDRADAEALYRLLEDEVLPLWGRRDPQGRAREWLVRARRALATIPPRFDAGRMVAEYRDRAYAPLALRRLALEANGHARLKALAAARRRIRAGFSAVRVLEVKVGDAAGLSAGDALDVEVRVDLGALVPDDVHVEFVLGERPADEGSATGGVHDLLRPVVVRLADRGPATEGGRRFTGRYDLALPGCYGYGVRVRPRSEEAGLSPLHEPAVWA